MKGQKKNAQSVIEVTTIEIIKARHRGIISTEATIIETTRARETVTVTITEIILNKVNTSLQIRVQEQKTEIPVAA